MSSHVTFILTLCGSQGLGLDKLNMWINETPYYTWY